LAANGWQACTLTELGVEETPAEELLEVHETFEANALAKARHFARLIGLPVLADDSGLAVDLLGGAPGVRSKRWAGHDALSGAALDGANNRALLDAMASVASTAGGKDERTARYVCAAVWVDQSGEWVARGETEGRILWTPRGAGGFGYDPLFWSEELGATFAEVTREAKAAISHRGRAFRALLTQVAYRFAHEVS
jgi:XTP/dITP diphosphohydrolase